MTMVNLGLKGLNTPAKKGQITRICATSRQRARELCLISLFQIIKIRNLMKKGGKNKHLRKKH